MPDMIEMHRAFVEEIAGKRAILQRELERLDAVEEYHRNAMSTGQSTDNGESEVAPIEPANLTDHRLADTTRHGACVYALESIGRVAKTQEIADWLVDRGYGTEFDDPRAFSNTCFTAMTRHTELFRKPGRGEWELLNQ